MELTLRRRSEEDVKEFLSWKFEGVYSFYDNDIQVEKIDWIKQSVHSEKAFSVIDEKDNLIGNCEFYDGGDDGEEIVAVGVQMNPILIGKGLGSKFVHSIIEQGKEILEFNRLEITVADFNERAVKTYENEGFVKTGEYPTEIRGNTYNFISMIKEWE